MITTILISLHALVGTLILSAASLILLAGPKDSKLRVIGLIMILYGSASIALSLGFNSISVQQVTPWLLIELIGTYSSAPAAVLAALMILRPKAINNLYVAGIFWVFILLPPVLGLLDLTNISQAVIGTPILISLESLANTYLGGYISIQKVTTTNGYNFLLLQWIFFYTLWIFFPNLYVTINDRRSDHNNSTNALILLISAVLGSLLVRSLETHLPLTFASLLTNSLVSIGFFFVGIRIIRIERSASSADSWLQIILKNYSMFTKLITTTGLIVIPSIIFISFSSFSFFQNSLLTVADDNLGINTHHGADSTIDLLQTDLHDLEHLGESNRTRALLTNRRNAYQSLTQEQIQQQIFNRNEQWINNDMLLISDLLDPANNNEIRLLIEENPNLLSIILTDSHGGLITASRNPERYNFSNLESWRSASTNQETIISQASWNEDLQLYTLELAMPIINPEGEFAGVIIAQYDMTTLITNLQKFEQNNINFGLVTAQGNLIQSSGNVQDEFTIPIIALTPQTSLQSWNTYQIKNESHLVRTSEVYSSDTHFFAPWKIIAIQPVAQALSPLSTAAYTAAITAGIIIVISTIIIIALSQGISEPIRKLNDAATKILAGEIGETIEINTTDEIGTLANSFNKMTTDLNALVINLEDTIEDRTKDLQERAIQLEAAALVAQQAAEARDVTTLLDLVVNLISEKFNYYHAGIFLLDEHQRYAILQAANSEGGKRMLARNHKLQVGRVGVVGYAAGMGQPRIAQDVGADIVYYDNPDMPDTRSELALPLKVRDQVIGVLDVQSTEANAFSEEDIEILQVLADQVALAIDNTRLLVSSQKALQEIQTLYGRDTSRAWRQRLTGREISFTYDSTGLTRESSQTIPLDDNDTGLLSMPISLRGQAIGNLTFVRESQGAEWSEDENQLIEEILAQTALALENARLVNQIRLRSDQIQLLQEITALAASVLDEEQLLNMVAQKLNSRLQVEHCGIILLDDRQEYVELVASASEKESKLKTSRQVLLEEETITQLVIQNPHIIVVTKIEGEPQYQNFVQSFTTRKSGSLVLMPLTIRDQVIGFIFLENPDEKLTIDLEEENLFQQISAQISTAVESARLFSAEQEGRIAAAALLEITQLASASLDMNQVLNQATNRSAQAIQAHRCTIFLLDEREKLKPLISIYSDGSEMPDEEWELLQKRVHENYEDFPLHRLAANLRTPKIISDPITYQNIPLGWASDFNIENMLMVPLISQNKVIGTMIFDQIDRNLTFKKNQEDLAQTIAGQIATTLENAKLFEEAVHRAERERQVSAITAKIRSSNDPQEIMETAITELRMALAKSNTDKKPKDADQNRRESNNPGNGKDKA